MGYRSLLQRRLSRDVAIHFYLGLNMVRQVSCMLREWSPTVKQDIPAARKNTGSSNTAERESVTSKGPVTGERLGTTYLGGQNNDRGYAIAIDNNRDIYITGSTNSSDFPTTTTAFDSILNTGNSGFRDAFVAKLSADGSQLFYASFLGGQADDEALDIATNASGQAFVSGWTRSADFPLINPLQSGPSGKKDVFITRLNNLGQPVYSTYLGGQGDDVARAIAVDSQDRIYLTGFTASGDHDLSLPNKSTRPWPTTAGAYDIRCGQQGACDGSDRLGKTLTHYDAFLTRIDNAGSSLGYSTFLGGGRYDYGNALAITATGDIIVAGETLSADFPSTATAYISACQDRGDGQCLSAEGYVLRIRPNGTAGNDLVFASFIGGSAADAVTALSIDASERIYLALTSHSDDLPSQQAILAGPPERPDNAVLTRSRNAFVARLDSTASSLTFASYLGGKNDDRASAIAIDSNGLLHIAGYTLSANLPISNDANQARHGDLNAATSATTADDGFLLRIDTHADGNLAAELSSDAGTPVTLGQQVRFIATVKNLGLQTAEEVTLTDILPDAVIFAAGQSDPRCQYDSGRLNCQLGALPAGAQQQVSIVVQPKNQGNYQHQVTVSALQTDSNLADNTASNTIEVMAVNASTGGSAAFSWILLLSLVSLPLLRRADYPASGRRTSSTLGS